MIDTLHDETQAATTSLTGTKAREGVRMYTPVPGPVATRLLRRRMKEIPRSLHQMAPLFIREAHGALVTDVDGNVLIDFAGGIGALNTGHTHPAVTAALRAQGPHYLHSCFHVSMHEPYLRLAGKLNRMVPVPKPCKTAFFNSGAEAVENAVKIARCATGRPAIVAFEHAFHGRTLLAMSLTSKVNPYKAGFGPFAPEIYRLPFPSPYHRPRGMSEKTYTDHCIHGLRDFFRLHIEPSRVAAVIVEIQLGEGGFIPLPPAYARALADFCHEHGILMIVDEVQTGFARTGRMFACEHYGLHPDLVTMAKSLGGGMPLSAVTGKAAIMDSPQSGGIGGTYGGHPLSCVAALASIEVIEKEKLCARARLLGSRVKARLRHLATAIPAIGDVRGLGAMVGIEFVKDPRTREPDPEALRNIIHYSLQHGLILLGCGVDGNILRTLMPLTITDRQLEEALNILGAAIRHSCHETTHHPRGRRNHRPRHRLGLDTILRPA